MIISRTLIVDQVYGTMNLAPLKYLLYIENGVTIFRNYLCLKNRRIRIIVLCWILFTIFNLIFNVVVTFWHESAIKFNAQKIYYLSSTIFSIYVMIASLYYSRSFYKLLLNFNAFYNIFEDEIYNQRMVKSEKFCTVAVMLFCLTKICVYVSVRLINTDQTMDVLVSVSSQFNIAICDFRLIFEYFILRSIMFVLSEQLEAIIRSIDEELSVIGENLELNVENADSSRIAVNHDKLNKWTKAYENINDTSNLFNLMFSVQLTIMLLIVTAYYTILMYTITTITVKGSQPFTMMLVNLFSMAVFLIALFVISRGGQRIQNSSMELQQKLCELGLRALEDEKYYKLTKDLLRFVRTRPIRVHVFGTLDVNMTMLPSIVALFTTYSVIALQFNNVL